MSSSWTKLSEGLYCLVGSQRSSTIESDGQERISKRRGYFLILSVAFLEVTDRGQKTLSENPKEINVNI